MSEPWEFQMHVGNPSMARVKGLKLRPVPACEGGGWSTDVESARLIAAAPSLVEALQALVEDAEFHGTPSQFGASVAKARAALDLALNPNPLGGQK